MINEHASNRKYPIVEALRRGTFKSIPTWDSEMVANVLSTIPLKIEENIYCMSNVFREHVFNNSKKMFYIVKQDFISSAQGVILNFTDAQTSVVYNIREKYDYEVFLFRSEILIGFMLDDGSDTGPAAMYLDNSRIDNMYYHVAHLFAILAFMQYASVETKTVSANGMYKDINCKYINNTNTDITFLDSTWFTSLVKSDSFNVRGHFRLQPKKKDGEWTKELIWIDEFQKNGYTRTAKKLTQ